ncbi:MAG: hypothetical protein AABN95_16115 [Acidobacteriota bacterium]
MELSSFSENIVTERFERNGETATLQINIDAIVPDYYEVLHERLAPVIQRLGALTIEHQAIQDEIQKAVEQEEKAAKSKRKKAISIDTAGLGARLSSLQKEIALLDKETIAERLTCPVTLPDGSTTCLLKGWDTTVEGMAIPASKENIMRLAAKAVRVIWERVESRLETVKKTAEDQTTQNPMTPETMETGSQEFTIPLSAQVM